MKILKNKDFITFLSTLLVVLGAVIVFKTLIVLSNRKKEECNNNGGYVVEDFIGLYDQCIYKGEDKK